MFLSAPLIRNTGSQSGQSESISVLLQECHEGKQSREQFSHCKNSKTEIQGEERITPETREGSLSELGKVGVS